MEIKDVELPSELQRAMAAEAEASREATAKRITAEGERAASAILADAGRLLETSPTSIQLRYLQTLQSIAAENNSTIAFPVPVDLFSRLGAMLGGGTDAAAGHRQ